MKIILYKKNMSMKLTQHKLGSGVVMERSK